MRKILTIDVGGTFIKYAVMLGTKSFKIIYRDKFETPKKDRECFKKTLVELFKNYNDVEGITISLPGIIDSLRGRCIISSFLAFNNGYDIADDLKNICGVPVSVENDANCAALAEMFSGNLVGINDAIVLVFGTSIGGAIICNGKLHRGAHFTAGEIQLTLKELNSSSVDKNFWGDDINLITLQKKCAQKLNVSETTITSEMIFNLLHEGNTIVKDCLNYYVKQIAIKIFNLQMFFDPECFAIGGGLSAQKSFVRMIKDKIDKIYEKKSMKLPKPEIILCKFHNDANLYGALYRYLGK